MLAKDYSILLIRLWYYKRTKIWYTVSKRGRKFNRKSYLEYATKIVKKYRNGG